MLLDRAFWENFVASGLAALIGTFFGFALALWGERRVERQNRHDQRNKLLTVLWETMSRNQHILDHIQTDIEAKRPVLVSVIPTVLDSTATLKYELIDDIELDRQIDLLRYEFHYLDRKLQLLLTLTYSAAPPAGGYHSLDGLLDNIGEHAARLNEAVAAVLARIETVLGSALSAVPVAHLEMEDARV